MDMRPDYLILIDFTVLQFSFSLLLERDDNQGHEDVDEEEWKDDEVDDVENGHFDAKVLDGALVLVRGRHRVLQDLRPAFAGLDGEQRQHGHHHVVVMKGLGFPFPWFELRYDITLLENEVLTAVTKAKLVTISTRTICKNTICK